MIKLWENTVRKEDKNMLLYNDQFCERKDVPIDPEDRGYQFGDGVYEVIRVYDGVPFYLEEHLQRLQRSAHEIQLSLPYAIEKLSQRILELIKMDQLTTGNIYLQVTRGVASRNHAFPSSATPVLTGYTIPAERPLSSLTHGIHTITTEDIRWLRCDIKSLNLLGAVLAKQKAIDADCYEAILIRDHYVSEGSSTNVFFIKDEILYTSPADNLILHGITRAIVIRLAKHLHLPVKEIMIPENMISSCDECFITSTTSEVTPVIKIDDRIIGEGSPGPLTQKLQRAYEQEINEVCHVS